MKELVIGHYRLRISPQTFVSGFSLWLTVGYNIQIRYCILCCV